MGSVAYVYLLSGDAVAQLYVEAFGRRGKSVAVDVEYHYG